jgi:alpha-galactosidase
MIEQKDGFFALHTAHTSYLFRTEAAGHLEHLYYGARIATGGDTAQALALKQSFAPGCTVAYSKEHGSLCMEQLCQEVSTLGKGDYAASFVALAFADGGTTCDFVFDSAEVLPDDAALPDEVTALPAAHGGTQTLAIRLKDVRGLAALTLYYTVFEECDVITRRAVLQNTGEEPLVLQGLASLQLDLPDSGWVFTAFRGGWTNEWHRTDTPCETTVLAESRLGCTSSRCQNFVMLHRADATETAGEVLGLHLLYSGNFRTSAEPGRWGRLRLLSGIHPEGFAWTLAPGESFASPEAALCCAQNGYGELSSRLHDFVRAHILPLPNPERLAHPVVMNSWEACYFKFDEAALLRQARLGAACGAELFVLDDGWFGKRNDDTTSLGDWVCNTKKLPDGLSGLADKLHGLGMDFGLWLEPEMVSEDSDLYRAHPDWAMRQPGCAHSEGRGQMILDMANPAVQEYVIGAVADVLHSAAIRYIKWDMNRSFSDVYSPWAAAQGLGQRGTAHRYMLGLYHVLQTLTKAFPAVLFEACASGGNRTDLGMLCYMPQVWLSDNTDPVCRAEMQYNASYGLPPCVMSCHVSASPNHQTLRATPLDSRFGVAVFGQLGYELDFTALSGKERAEVKEQTDAYKNLRGWIPDGRFFRLGREGGSLRWMTVSSDGAAALALLLEPSAKPDRTGRLLRMRGLQEDAVYHFHAKAKPVELALLGSLVNTVSPVHIKPGGVLHSIAAQFVHLPGETEDAVLPGSVLNHAGVRLKAPYTGSGLDGETAVWSDFGCRLYWAEKTEQ